MADKDAVVSGLKRPKKEPQFTKSELLEATNLTGKQRDVLNVALDENKTYTSATAKVAVDVFKGGLF